MLQDETGKSTSALRAELEETVQLLRKDRGGDDSEHACLQQAKGMFALQDVGRQHFNSWLDAGMTKSREGVFNVECGDSGTAGTNPEYYCLLVDGTLKTKIEVGDDMTPASMVADMQLDAAPSAKRVEWLSAALKDLRSLGSLQGIKATDEGVFKDDVRCTTAVLSFPFGMDRRADHPSYHDYLLAQRNSLYKGSLYFQSLFGRGQIDSFAASLLQAPQFRETGWTSGTLICKGERNGDGVGLSERSGAQGNRRRQEAERLLEELDARLATEGFAAIGFRNESDVELVRAMLQRFMKPHGDVMDDVLPQHFFSLLALILKRSGGGPPGRDGALELLGKPVDAGKQESKDHRRVLHFMQTALANYPMPSPRSMLNSECTTVPPALSYPASLPPPPSSSQPSPTPPPSPPMPPPSPPASPPSSPIPSLPPSDDDETSNDHVGEHVSDDVSNAAPHHLVRVPASEDGTATICRPKTQVHGAAPIPLEGWRDVNVFYVTTLVAQCLRCLKQQIPALFVTVDGGEDDRRWIMRLLKRFVLAHVALEVPSLRSEGLWKPSTSKHSGEKVYRKQDA